MSGKEDPETKQRLLDAAAQLFAERGYQQVSIRDICAAANANVAAVNYYFHDKWALYEELIRKLIEGAKHMQQLAHESPPGTPPDEQLRNYIRTFMQHGLAPVEEKDRWAGKLMGREMVDPTPGLDLFIDEVIRPNSKWLGELIGELMGLPPTDWRVGSCVGSVQTQIVGYFGPVVKRMVPGLEFTPEIIAGIANHITTFSLAGIRAISQLPIEVKQ
jgi:TetR/AcrR family transcriptional regulator, regulator of cefoperazone and chloramphenicol sensitivity